MKNLEHVFMVSVLVVGNELVFIVRDRSTKVTATTSDPAELGDIIIGRCAEHDEEDDTIRTDRA